MNSTLPAETVHAIQAISTLAAGGGGASDIAAGEPSAAWPLLLALVQLGIVFVFLGIVLCIYRILKGPHLADRILASDSLSIHVVALVLLLTIALESTFFFDVALAVAIIGFAGTVAFAQYIGARQREGHDDEAPPLEHASPSPPQQQEDVS